jgi:ABC-type ATPase involved in cell division
MIDDPEDAVIDASGLVLSPFPGARPFAFRVARGERWLLRGPSRSGKSPLIKTLSGLISPGAGRVALFGVDLHDVAPSSLLALRRRCGMVFAMDGLMPAWTGFENLALPLRYHDRMPLPEGAALIAEVAARYAVPTEWLDNPVAGLNAEQRLALALLRAVLGQPELLLIDGVPLDAVEAFSGFRAGRLLEDAIARGCAVIIALPEESEIDANTETRPDAESEIQSAPPPSAGNDSDTAMARPLPALLRKHAFRTAEMRAGRIESVR